MAGTFHELCALDLPYDKTFSVAVNLKNILIDINTVRFRLFAQKEDTGVWAKVNRQFAGELKQAIVNCCTRPEYDFKLTPLCLVLGKVSVLEIRSGAWPNCLAELSQFATHQDSQTKRAGIMTLAYACEDLRPDEIGAFRDEVIGALLGNVAPENEDISKMALKAFNEANLVTDQHFSDEQKRNFILAQMVKMFNS